MRLTPTYIQFLTAIRYLYGVPYRQLEGFTRALHRLVPQLPPGDYSGLRKRSLTLNPDPYRHLKETDEPITIAVDSTGVKVRLAGGWVERKHGKKKRYVKLHFAVNVETKEIVAMEVSTDDVHDVKAFRCLLEGAEERRRISGLLEDGGVKGDVIAVDSTHVDAYSQRAPDNRTGKCDPEARVGRGRRGFILGYRVHTACCVESEMPLAFTVAP